MDISSDEVWHKKPTRIALVGCPFPKCNVLYTRGAFNAMIGERIFSIVQIQKFSSLVITGYILIYFLTMLINCQTDATSLTGHERATSCLMFGMEMILDCSY
jgi:hypothetical protein